MPRTPKSILRTLGAIIMVPLIVVALLVALAYCPPVQKWLVNKVGGSLEETLGMRVHVDDVRITPFLDLVAEGVVAVDTEGDTLLNTRRLTFDVAFWPLFSGRADIDGFTLDNTRLNTKGLIPDYSIHGTVGHLGASAHGIEWTPELARITEAELRDANLYVAMADTAVKDSTTAPLRWVIDVDKARINNTRLHLTLPPDSVGKAMGVEANLKDAWMLDGHFDLGRPYYGFRRLQLTDGEARVSRFTAAPRKPDDADEELVSLYHLGAAVDSLSNDEHGTLRCNVSQLAFDEGKYNLHVKELAGRVYLDSSRVELPSLRFGTLNSRLSADVALDWEALRGGDAGQMKVKLDGNLARQDIEDLMATAVREKYVDASLLKNNYLKPFLQTDVSLKADVAGNLQHLTVGNYQLTAKSSPGGARLLSSEGSLEFDDNFSSFGGRVQANLSTANREVHNMLTKALSDVDKSLPKNELVRPLLNADVSLRAAFKGNQQRISVSDYSLNAKSSPVGKSLLSAKGNLNIGNDFKAYSGSINASVLGGNVAGNFSADLGRETYNVAADVRNLPLSKFVDGLDAQPFTGRIEAQGQGFDPTSANANLKANVKVQHLSIMGYDLSGLATDVALRGGKALANIGMQNAMGRISGTVDADMANGYDVTAHLRLNDIDLRQLCGLKDTIALNTVLDVHATASKDLKRMTAEGSLHNNFVSSPRRSAELKDLAFGFSTTPDRTSADIAAGDLTLYAACNGGLNYISESAERFTSTLMRQLDNKAIDQEELRQVMPSATLQLHSGQDNPLHNFLLFQGTKVESIDLDLAANSTQGLSGKAQVGTIQMGQLQLDTIHADITHGTNGIRLQSTIHNYRKDNPNRFTATVDAGLQERGFETAMVFKDETGRKGIDLGVRAETYQGTATFTISPKNPTFAYRSFTINDDNFISINRQGMIRADVHLVADDGTGLLVYSEPTDETTNDVTLTVNNLNLKELCDVMPYMPHLSGTLNGDFHVTEEHGAAADSASLSGPLAGHNLTAMGTIEARDFAYEGTPIGNLGAEVIYMPKGNGEHYADAFISFNGNEVGECSGVYYDTDGQFRGDIALNAFPLQFVNAFLEGTDFMMRGSAGGNFSASGTLDKPVMNGQLRFNDAHFFSPVYGVDFKMDERPIDFNNSRLEFDDYLLTSGNTDLKIDGDVNMTDLSKIRLNFAMAADNFELINTARLPSSLVFGRMVTNYNGTVKGTIDDLAVRGQLDVLPSTDLTYLLTNSPLSVDDRLSDLVTFMDFNDTTTVAEPVEETKTLYNVTLGINVSEGAKFHCFLSSNGKSYVDVQGGGNLTLRTTQEGDMKLLGRYTIEEGKMNYELPVIPMKTFDLAQGSYVEFSGDMMNPRLSITATQGTKAIVSDENDRQRSVNFVVGVDISRTLEDMGLAFTIDAPEDLSVQNQLAVMSEEDRYKTAVALLATGMYVTENLTTGLKASNALNAFLQNEIQNIAGKALSTFDLSFGMENGTSSRGTLTTDYSFKFSKRFLDDRISINIGGSVQTGQDATNSAASFIDNISLEYRLDKSSTRYVRVFYDRDSHDPLEGSMMQTGAGLVLRRKTDRLGELFLFRKKK